MFIPKNTGSTLPFIQRYEMGLVAQYPSLFYCQVIFSVDHYHNGLFEQFSIPFPKQLNAAIIKRKAEYLASRYASQVILQTYGCFELPNTSSERSPIWPLGWCGSLSHSREYALAIVAPIKSNLIPGIDIEFFSSETMQMTKHIFTSESEQQLLLASGIDYATALLIVFSAKESLFKALYPEVRYLFDFEVAKVYQIDPLIQRITFALTVTLTPNRQKGCQIQGY